MDEVSGLRAHISTIEEVNKALAQKLEKAQGEIETLNFYLKDKEYDAAALIRLSKGLGERIQNRSRYINLSNVDTALDHIDFLNLQNESFRKTLLEIRAKLERSHDGGCILPLRDMVNDALGEGVMGKRHGSSPTERPCGLTKPMGNGETCKALVGHMGPCEYAEKRNDEKLTFRSIFLGCTDRAPSFIDAGILICDQQAGHKGQHTGFTNGMPCSWT